MKIKLYMCGWCGIGLTSNGNYLSDGAKITFKGINDAELIGCESCLNEYHHENESQRMQVTHDMAMDAQNMSLEGEWI